MAKKKKKKNAGSSKKKKGSRACTKARKGTPLWCRQKWKEKIFLTNKEKKRKSVVGAQGEKRRGKPPDPRRGNREGSKGAGSQNQAFFDWPGRGEEKDARQKGPGEVMKKKIGLPRSFYMRKKRSRKKKRWQAWGKGIQKVGLLRQNGKEGEEKKSFGWEEIRGPAQSGQRSKGIKRKQYRWCLRKKGKKMQDKCNVWRKRKAGFFDNRNCKKGRKKKVPLFMTGGSRSEKNRKENPGVERNEEQEGKKAFQQKGGG